MKRSPFGEWILILLIVCVAIAYWYIALALAVAFALGVWGYRRLVDRAARELEDEPLYVSDIVDPGSRR